VAVYGSHVRFEDAGAVPGCIVDVQAVGASPSGWIGAGSVHHIAFRAADDSIQARMVAKLASHHRSHAATAQKDRNCFPSVHFSKPGDILFEITTNDPDLLADEPLASPGQALKLAPILEPQRRTIEAALRVIS
jgi:glyoxalase family protein